jgi:flagellar operon protein (TIGR03826 family)
MSLNVGNCPRCGKLYAKNPKDLCPACVKEIELQYETCSKYLRENKGSTIQQLSDATETPVKQIVKFIREGRIAINNMPNISYPCEVCGTEIRESNICESCRSRLAKDVSNIEEDRKRAEGQRKEGGNVTFNIKDRLNDRFR